MIDSLYGHRLEGESFEEYKERQKTIKEYQKMKKRGILYSKINGQ